MPSQSRPARSQPVAALLPLREIVLFPEIVCAVQVSREHSRRAVRYAQEKGKRLLAVSVLNDTEELTSVNLHHVGVLAEVQQVSPLPDGSLRVVLKGTARAAVVGVQKRAGYLVARAVELSSRASSVSERLEAKVRYCRNQFERIAIANHEIPSDAVAELEFETDYGLVADSIAHHMPIPLGKKRQLLEAVSLDDRFDKLLEILASELKLLEIQREIVEKVDRSFGSTQREYYLREQLKAIQSELGDASAEQEVNQWLDRLKASGMPSDAFQLAEQEARRLESSSSGSAESSIIRNYLEWLATMPWSTTTRDSDDILRAKEILDKRHYGLDAVKDRILEFLAVRKLTRSLRGPILCFTGPPGVGKTSAAMSIAESLGRKFVSFSLGGVRDEAEIRGHRRTYVGAMPGQIIREIRRCGSRNPVFLLDEIDKISREYRGDPAGALLEALDPAQNSRFQDHFLDVPFDLSETIFIATANTIDAVMPALRDRMEIVEFGSYSDDDRFEIARSHLVPRAVREHGLEGKLNFTDSAIQAIVERHSAEAGVRQAGQQIAAVCRKAAVKAAEGGSIPITVDFDDVKAILGPPIRGGEVPRLDRVGRCSALAVSEAGGVEIPIEVALLKPVGASPAIFITGNLGTVMEESARTAMSAVRLILDSDPNAPALRQDVHIHCGQAAIPKDGPSAGLALAAAIYSAVAGRRVRGDVAATGEVGLLGDVHPVGGIREKLVAAKKLGFAVVLMPRANEPEVRHLPAKVVGEIEVVFVESISAALEIMCPHPKSSATKVY